VIKGVIKAEQGAIDHYSNIIKTCGDDDPVTADMVVKILADEERHMRLFEGFLKEYEKKG
jgi:bacterioferritin